MLHTSWQVDTVMEQRTHLKGTFIKNIPIIRSFFYMYNKITFIQSIDHNQLAADFSNHFKTYTICIWGFCIHALIQIFPLFGVGQRHISVILPRKGQSGSTRPRPLDPCIVYCSNGVKWLWNHDFFRISLSVCPSVRPSVNLSARLSIYLSIYADYIYLCWLCECC